MLTHPILNSSILIHQGDICFKQAESEMYRPSTSSVSFEIWDKFRKASCLYLYASLFEAGIRPRDPECLQSLLQQCADVSSEYDALAFEDYPARTVFYYKSTGPNCHDFATRTRALTLQLINQGPQQIRV